MAMTDKEEVTGVWTEMHDELHDLYCLSDIIKVMRSRKMILAGHVARVGEEFLLSFGQGIRREETTSKA
jgi:hypothetical protein